MAKNAGLNRAKKEKNDEFYTMFVDIEKELQHYSKHFQNKIVYCNCDDPSWSNFWLYFHLNYDRLGLKGLVSTHFTKDASSYKAEYHGWSDWNGLEWVETPFSGDGDFRSEECVEVLKAADIVVTNPPFSLFREFVAGLVEYQKQFLVIGNMNAITTKEIFPHIKGREIWLGDYKVKQFRSPNGLLEKSGHSYWFSNLKSCFKRKRQKLTEHYYEEDGVTPKPEALEKYKKYDNYDAINCDKSKDIPVDYFPCWYKCSRSTECTYAKTEGTVDDVICENKCSGIIGVPPSFFDPPAKGDLEVIGTINHGSDGEWDLCKCVIGGAEIFKRIAVRHKFKTE